MKYLKYILGILAVLIIAFLLVGMIKSKVAYDCEIMVEKPIAESWAVTQDETKLGDWIPGFQKVEHISGTPGTAGSVSNVHFISDGEEMTIRETINEIIPNESISMTYESDFMDMDYFLKMTDVDGKTKINSSTTAVGNGMISKSIMALVGGSIKAQEETNLVNLKKTIESNTTNYFPVVEEIPETVEQ